MTNGIAVGMRVERKSANDRRRSRSRVALVTALDDRYAYVRWDTGRHDRILAVYLRPATKEAAHGASQEAARDGYGTDSDGA